MLEDVDFPDTKEIVALESGRVINAVPVQINWP